MGVKTHGIASISNVASQLNKQPLARAVSSQGAVEPAKRLNPTRRNAVKAAFFTLFAIPLGGCGIFPPIGDPSSGRPSTQYLEPKEWGPRFKSCCGYLQAFEKIGIELELSRITRAQKAPAAPVSSVIHKYPGLIRMLQVCANRFDEKVVQSGGISMNKSPFLYDRDQTIYFEFIYSIYLLFKGNLVDRYGDIQYQRLEKITRYLESRAKEPLESKDALDFYYIMSTAIFSVLDDTLAEEPAESGMFKPKSKQN